MNARPDLSTDALAIETDDQSIRIIARPRRQLSAFVTGLVVTAISILPVLGLHESLMKRWNRGDVDVHDWVQLLVCWGPLVLVVITSVSIYRRRGRLCGIEIINGIVTVYTPDQPIARHEFERYNLVGAHLKSTSNGNDLRIERRSGLTITLFIGYDYPQIAPAVNVINAMVLEDRKRAFEVIPIAQAVQKPERQG